MPHTITRQSFQERNKEGDYAVEVVRRTFESCGFTVDIRHAYHRRDIAVQNQNCTALIEVKNETRYANKLDKTACIEMYQGRDKHRSGLAISQASHFIHLFGDEVFAYESQPMRNYLEDCRKSGLYQLRDFGKADNGNGGFIVKRDHVYLSKSEFVFDGPLSGLPTCPLFNSDFKPNFTTPAPEDGTFF